jgi:hypothetical protein
MATSLCDKDKETIVNSGVNTSQTIKYIHRYTNVGNETVTRNPQQLGVNDVKEGH